MGRRSGSAAHLSAEASGVIRERWRTPAIIPLVLRTLTEERVRDGVTYRVETSWDDETGNA
jgi:hypothetical protein